MKEDFDATENIINVIQAIADNLPRVDLYQQLHEDARFDTALVNLFADITEFCNQAYEFFNRRSASMYHLNGIYFRWVLIRA